MGLLIYSLLFYLALPFILLRLWQRGRKAPAYRERWRERLGFVPRSPAPVIWVHAVSVGETIAAAPLVERLLARYPDTPILLSAMTPTGAARARALFGDRVRYAYAPYDFPGAVDRFLERVHPLALIIMETELWPNTVARVRATGAPVILANARLSQRSARGYRRVRWLSAPLFAQLDWIAAQAEDDARRFAAAGARPTAVAVTGSIKFDVAVSPQLRSQSEALREQLGRDRPIWIAASTHDGEDSDLLEAHRQILDRFPDTLLVLVPRHPERFDAVARLVTEAGFSLARRSRSESAREAQVYLADTMGELLMLYGVADVAFVGGSLVERGGHNPLEPAAWGIPVLMGPHVFNFADVCERLDAGQGLAYVDSPAILANRLIAFTEDPEHRRATGANAEAVLAANRGALARLVAGIEQRMPISPSARSDAAKT